MGRFKKSNNSYQKAVISLLTVSIFFILLIPMRIQAKEIVPPTGFTCDNAGNVSFQASESNLYYQVKVITPGQTIYDFEKHPGTAVHIGYRYNCPVNVNLSSSGNFTKSGTYTVYLLGYDTMPYAYESKDPLYESEHLEIEYTLPAAQLATPTNLRWEYDSKNATLIACWGPVEGAGSYTMETSSTNGLPIMGASGITETSWDLSYLIKNKISAWETDLMKAECSFRVYAVTGDIAQYTNSQMSGYSPTIRLSEILKPELKMRSGALVSTVSSVDCPNYKGYIAYNGSSFLWANGAVVKSANGPVQDVWNDSNNWYYCVNGQVATKKSGLVQYGKGAKSSWFYIENGKLDTAYTGLVSYNNGLFMVAKGRILTEKTGLIQDPNNKADWYFLANGQVQTKKTGIAIYNGAGFYVVNGKLNSAYIGQVMDNGTVYNVVNGRVV